MNGLSLPNRGRNNKIRRIGASNALSARPRARQPFPHALGVGRGSRSGRAKSGVPIRSRPVAGCRAPRGRELWDQPERRGARRAQSVGWGQTSAGGPASPGQGSGGTEAIGGGYAAARGGEGTSSLSRASSGRRVSGRVCTATIRRGPPQRGQGRTSRANARLIGPAHAQWRGFSAAGSAFTLGDTLAATGASPGGAPYEITRARQAAFGASTPWQRTTLVRGRA